MRLTPGVTIDGNDTVTRQTLFDLWNQSIPGTVGQTDLDGNTLSLVVQESAPSPAPGRLWFDQTEDLLKYYCDVFDNTGVSCWLSIGPDRFDVPMLATQPIPRGAAVQFVDIDKKVRLAPSKAAATDIELIRVIGCNQDTQTTASGTWAPIGVLGLMTMWYGLVSGETAGTWVNTIGAGGATADRALCLASHVSAVDGMIRFLTSSTNRKAYLGMAVSPASFQVNGVFKGLFLGPCRQKLAP